jgi:hypothetical protein
MTTSSFAVPFSLQHLIGGLARALNTGRISRLGCGSARFWSRSALSLEAAGACWRFS